ncbi:hypothetical protein PGB90_000475 [Kerria lacca]
MFKEIIHKSCSSKSAKSLQLCLDKIIRLTVTDSTIHSSFKRHTRETKFAGEFSLKRTFRKIKVVELNVARTLPARCTGTVLLLPTKIPASTSSSESKFDKLLVT